MIDQATPAKPARPAELDRLCVNTIRFLSIDAVQKANSGHPGLPMGAAPMAYELWTRFLKHNPSNPLWADRDRFVLSAGHGSMLLYSLLHLTGYREMTIEQIRNFRQWGSITPGHPERLPAAGPVTFGRVRLGRRAMAVRNTAGVRPGPCRVSTFQRTRGRMTTAATRGASTPGGAPLPAARFEQLFGRERGGRQAAHRIAEAL